MAKIVKMLLFRLSLIFYRILYQLSGLFVRKHRVVFVSYRQVEDYDNYYYLMNYFKDHSDYEIELHNYYEKKRKTLSLMTFVIKGIVLMRTSEIVIIDDYFLPIYTIKNKHNTFIMLWHASGAFKRFGYSVRSNQYGLKDSYKKAIDIHTNYDMLFGSGDGVIEPYQEAFDVDPSIIKTVGLPHLDYFYNQEDQTKSIHALYEQYPFLQGKKIILYSPTFRGVGQRSANFQMDPHLLKEMKRLDDDTVVIFKKHPFVQDCDFSCNKIITIDDFNISVLMMVSDVMITDYSSVIYEFSLLDKPIYLYTPDIKKYKDTRDFYFDLHQFDSVLYTHAVTLIDDIEHQTDVSKEFRAFLKKQAFGYFDNLNTKRVYETIINR